MEALYIYTDVFISSFVKVWCLSSKVAKRKLIGQGDIWEGMLLNEQSKPELRGREREWKRAQRFLFISFILYVSKLTIQIVASSKLFDFPSAVSEINHDGVRLQSFPHYAQTWYRPFNINNMIYVQLICEIIMNFTLQHLWDQCDNFCVAFVRSVRQFLCGICEISETISVWHLWDQWNNFCVAFVRKVGQILCGICEISTTISVWHLWDQ
jgi:hypothetical protein